MKAISFFMNEQTERAASRLADSLSTLKIENEFESVPDQGSYHANRQHVPAWILWKLLDDPGQSVLWLNATASVLSDPVLLREPDGDFAVYKEGAAYWAKTLYVRNCDASRKTLRRWADLNLEFPYRISCENFTQAIEETKPRLTFLPPTYSWVEESFSAVYKNQKPVIIHPIGGL